MVLVMQLGGCLLPAQAHATGSTAQCRLCRMRVAAGAEEGSTFRRRSLSTLASSASSTPLLKSTPLLSPSPSPAPSLHAIHDRRLHAS